MIAEIFTLDGKALHCCQSKRIYLDRVPLHIVQWWHNCGLCLLWRKRRPAYFCM